MTNLKSFFNLFLKGAGMGAANVIPGVSGGTVALITGIFEDLIHAIKSFDLASLKLLFKGNFKAFSERIKLPFLIAVFAGVIVSVITLARLLDFLFVNYPVYVWSYFFGLILASVYFVGKTIDKWNVGVLAFFILGTGIAGVISFLNPATENSGFVYLIICGVVAICSMILPGLSGSFVLILMGNYQLVVIDAVNDVNLKILLPVIIGAGLGLLAFSHLLSYVYAKFKNQTIALLTGFILGSLLILWPWKNARFDYLENGALRLDSHGEPLIVGYTRYVPQELNLEVILAVTFVVLGILSIWIIEKTANSKQ